MLALGNTPHIEHHRLRIVLRLAQYTPPRHLAHPTIETGTYAQHLHQLGKDARTCRGAIGERHLPLPYIDVEHLRLRQRGAAQQEK